MITIMMKYNSPMLQVVSINKNDVIATSLNVNNEVQNNIAGEAPDRIRDWDVY